MNACQGFPAASIDQRELVSNLFLTFTTRWKRDETAFLTSIDRWIPAATFCPSPGGQWWQPVAPTGRNIG